MDVEYIEQDSATTLENWKAAWQNSGTPWEDPGTRQPMSGVVMSVDTMEIDEPVLGTHPVPAWAQPIMTFMLDGTLPSDEVSARQIQR